MCDTSEYECQELWLWMIRTRKNDSEFQKEEKWWLKMSEWVCTMALNVKTKERCWHWTPNWRNMVALNAKLEANNGFERQTKYVALNAKLKNGFKCQTKNTAQTVKLKQTTTLNVKMKMWLWTSNWKRYGGSEQLTEERHADSECRTEDMALNVELKKNW